MRPRMWDLAQPLRTIEVELLPPRTPGPEGLWTLGVRWHGDRRWVEVRGTYDVDPPEGELQFVLDSLPGALVGGELMAGHTAAVNGRMYASAWPALARLLR